MMNDIVPLAAQWFLALFLGGIAVAFTGLVFFILAKGAMELYADFRKSILYKDIFGEDEGV